MKIISHRGNLTGPKSCVENHPESLHTALLMGFMVEVDIHVLGSDVYLGHDGPQFDMDFSLLGDENCIFHAKNLAALDYLMDLGVHCFWHQEDQVTITNKGKIWCYPGTQLVSPRAIHLDFNQRIDMPFSGWGICTDYPLHYETLETK